MTASPDLLDMLAAWNVAQAALVKCRARLTSADDPAYYCGLLIEDEQAARIAFHRELRREIAARLAAL